ncbi:hypothetical protein JCM10212_000758 [Sporobolomyces blumeae]
MISLRIRSPTGAASCSLAPDASLADLHDMVSRLTQIPRDRQELRSGFPPKPLDSHLSLGSKLEQAGIRSGDTVIVAERSRSSTPAPVVPSRPQPAAREVESLAPTSDRTRESETESRARPTAGVATTPSSTPESVEVDGGYLVLRVVPDDNSCLFTACSLVLNPSAPPNPSSLRRVVADTIRSNPSDYSEAILGRDPLEYIETILSPSSWGGAIELAILSKHHETELWSVDVQTGRIDKFGEGAGFDQVGIVVYSGIHYDALSFSFAPPSRSRFPPDLSFDTTIFPLPLNPDLVSATQRLVDSLRSKHAFTDTANFTLKCQVCSEAIVGEKEARDHARATGHTAFGEYDG